MTSAWAFRKAISNLHFDLVVSKLLKITAALSWNQNMLAAPQDLEQKPHIYPRRKLERRIKPERGKLTFFFMIPLFPLCTHPQTHSDGKGMPPPWRRFCQPPLTRSSWAGRGILSWAGKAGTKLLAGRRKRGAVCLGFVLGQLNKAGGNDVCPGPRVLIL